VRVIGRILPDPGGRRQFGGLPSGPHVRQNARLMQRRFFFTWWYFAGQSPA